MEVIYGWSLGYATLKFIEKMKNMAYLTVLEVSPFLNTISYLSSDIIESSLIFYLFSLIFCWEALYFFTGILVNGLIF